MCTWCLVVQTLASGIFSSGFVLASLLAAGSACLASSAAPASGLRANSDANSQTKRRGVFMAMDGPWAVKRGKSAEFCVADCSKEPAFRSEVLPGVADPHKI